jgi:hypothetical protein
MYRRICDGMQSVDGTGGILPDATEGILSALPAPELARESE